MFCFNNSVFIKYVWSWHQHFEPGRILKSHSFYELKKNYFSQLHFCYLIEAVISNEIKALFYTLLNSVPNNLINFNQILEKQSEVVMVTEWWLNDNWMVTGKVDFSRFSATIQSTEWQPHFSDLSVRLFFEI